jgi:aconitate decarboxylase
MSLTKKVTEKIVSTKFSDIPDAALTIAGECMLDAIATTVAGASEAAGVGRISIEYAKQVGGKDGECTLIAGGVKVSAPAAAYANGTMCHALDYDNTAWPRNHPASPTIPAILGMAERQNSPGSEVLRAIVLAFELQFRIRVASQGRNSGGIFHHPGIGGTMGAVAGVGTILGLTVDQMVMAFGNAGSRAGTITTNHGTMTKPSHSGIGSQMGTEAAMLGALGWTAGSDIFGKGEFFDTFYGEGRSNPPVMLENFGDPYRMVDPGVSYKLYPAKYSIHRSIEGGILVATDNDIDPNKIKAVDIFYPPTALIDRPKPRSGLDGKFSLQYGAAAGILDRHVGISTFTDKRLFADDMQTLLPKITIHEDKSIPMDFPDSWIIVRVTTEDGQIFETKCAKLRGQAGAPLPRETRIGKFYDCVDGSISKDDADRVVAIAEGMAGTENVHALMEILRNAKPG